MRKCLLQFYVNPADCKWAAWEKWSTCTQSCGGGTQLRSRIVKTYATEDGNCNGESLEEQECNTETCPAGMSIKILSKYTKKEYLSRVHGENKMFMFLFQSLASAQPRLMELDIGTTKCSVPTGPLHIVLQRRNATKGNRFITSTFTMDAEHQLFLVILSSHFNVILALHL